MLMYRCILMKGIKKFKIIKKYNQKCMYSGLKSARRSEYLQLSFSLIVLVENCL
jgi:hypothetical protein